MAQKQERNWVAIITMFFIFGMISFVTNMAAPFGNIWGFKYEWAGMAGNLMNFLAYLFMGIPAGNMLIKFGYKKTALIALAVGFIGLGIQWLSSKVGADVAVCEIAGQICSLNLFIYLLGALGGGNSGNQLIQAGGTINSLTGTLTPMLVGVLIGTLTKNTTMAEVSPLVIAGMVIFAVSFCIISFVKIEEPQGDLSNVTYERSPLAFRHCLLGIIAIFFYVGIEIGVPNEMNMWISRLPFEGAAAVAGSLAAAYWFLMLCGRFLSTIISGKVSTRTQMITVSSVAILLLLCAIFTGNINISLFGGEVPLSCLFIFLCGLCTSIMWGGIFNLSTEGLGKYTAKASGLFMTMVVGGGVMPFIQDNLVRPVTGYLGSYWLIIAMIAYILFYSLWGSKNVNKDIKVD